MRSAFLALITLAALTIRSFSADVSVATKLSHRTAEVGRALQLQVEVSGAGEEIAPPEIAVDGLDIRYVGPSSSRQIQITNGRMSQEFTTTFLYQVVPERAGDFTVPALQVNIGGRNYRTQPVALKVQKSGGSGGGKADAEEQAQAFAEIDVKKKTAYVGEVIPVEVRLFVDRRVRVEDVTNMPELTGDGFTMQKFPRFEQTTETRDGRDYLVLVFRTAMTPSKAGKLTIGPSDIPFVAQVPRPRRNTRSRSLFDSIFGDDAFDPFGAFGERRRYSARAGAVELDVKPLPAEGKPKSFSGAVGQFQFEGQGSPGEVKIGEPITMRLRVSGVGNFDRMEAPSLVDPTGWQTYDASAKFEAGDELKTSGTKTFEIPVVPETKHQQMPQFEFSYFDPGDGSYKSLQTKPAPLVVQGEPLVTPATPAPFATATPPPASETPSPSTAELAGLRYEEGARKTFDPVYTRPIFLVGNGAAALCAVALLSARWLRREPMKARIASLKRQRDEAWRKLPGASDEDFYDYAARIVQLETAILKGVDPATVDATLARKAGKLDADTAAGIESIFDARAERLYAGGAVAAKIGEAERARVTELLQRIRPRS